MIRDPEARSEISRLRLKTKMLEDRIAELGKQILDMKGRFRVTRRSDSDRGAADEAGELIFNTDDGQLNVADGTNWTLPDGTTT